MSAEDENDGVARLFTALLETEEPAQKTSNLSTDVRRLSEALQLTEDEYEVWIGSEPFEGPWKEFCDDYLNRAKTAGKGESRGPSLQTVQTIIKAGESLGSREFSKVNPNKETWKIGQHLARLLYRLRVENLQDADGIFFGKNIKTETVDALLWQVILRERHQAANSRSKSKNKGKQPEVQASPAAEAGADNREQEEGTSTQLEDTRGGKMIGECQFLASSEPLLEGSFAERHRFFTDALTASMKGLTFTVQAAVWPDGGNSTEAIAQDREDVEQYSSWKEQETSWNGD